MFDIGSLYYEICTLRQGHFAHCRDNINNFGFTWGHGIYPAFIPRAGVQPMGKPGTVIHREVDLRLVDLRGARPVRHNRNLHIAAQPDNPLFNACAQHPSKPGSTRACQKQLGNAIHACEFH